MGWMAWERFRCDIDCFDDPENCIRYDQLGNFSNQFTQNVLGKDTEALITNNTAD